MFVLFVQVFVFYYGMFWDCLTSGQIVLSLKIKKLLYVKQTFEDAVYSKNPRIRTSTFKNQQPKIWGF